MPKPVWCAGGNLTITRSCSTSSQQRHLHRILWHSPITAGCAQFCLLCCQPEPIPGSLTTRVLTLTSEYPYEQSYLIRMPQLHAEQYMLKPMKLSRISPKYRAHDPGEKIVADKCFPPEANKIQCLDNRMVFISFWRKTFICHNLSPGSCALYFGLIRGSFMDSNMYCSACRWGILIK